MPWTKEQKQAQRAASKLVRTSIQKPTSSNLPLPRAANLDLKDLPTEPPTMEEVMQANECARMELEDLRGRVMAGSTRTALLGQRVFLPGEKVIVKEAWWSIICPPLRNGQEPRIKFLLDKLDVRREVWRVVAAQGPHKGKAFFCDIPDAALEHA